MMKRLLVILTVFVLLMTATTAFAAKKTKPTAVLLSGSTTTVKAGKSFLFRFKLDSGDYGKKDDAFRAKLGVTINYKSKQLGAASWVWAGRQTYKLRGKLSKKAATGKYVMKYTTYYRTKASAAWKKVKTKSAKFTVK
jgi:hypothetical protein